jgi:hypothetical protein
MNASDGALLEFLPWAEVERKFENEMRPHYSLNRGMIPEDFTDVVANIAIKLYNENYIRQMDMHKLTITAIASALDNTREYVSKRFLAIDSE